MFSEGGLKTLRMRKQNAEKRGCRTQDGASRQIEDKKTRMAYMQNRQR